MSGKGYTFATDIFRFMTEMVEKGVSENIVAISIPLSNVMLAALFLYSVYLCYSWLMSHNVEMLKEGLKVFFLLGVVTSFAIKTDYYISNIVPIVLNLGDELGAIVTKSSATSAGASLDTFSTTIITTVSKIWKNASGIEASLLALLSVTLILLGAIPFALTILGILIMAKVMVALLLSVGTIFISFALFPQTRSWFQQWLNMCWNYSLITMLFPMALAILMKAIDNFVFKDGVLMTDLGTTFKLSVIMLAFNVIAVQIPVLASSLSGGIGINGMSGSFSSMVNSVRGVGRGAFGFGKGMFNAGRKARGLSNKAREANKNRRNPNIKAG